MVTQTGQLTPGEWLASAEKLWRPQLESAGLAIEVLADIDKTTKASQAFGMLYHASPKRGYRALQQHPAALVMAFTGVATAVYEGGRFWPGFWETCGHKATQADQIDWGAALLRGLRILGLPTFPGLPKSILGPLLLHTGIPNYCLPDYFQVLEVGMRRVGADADALVQWAIPRLDTTFANIDMPVRRFLQYGGEYAVDFVDQSLDALLALTDDPDTVVNSMIPERVVDAARGFLATDRARARSIKQRAGKTKPRITIVLDPYAGELQLRLPALDAYDDYLVWNIAADGATSTIRPLIATSGWTVSVLESSWRIDKPIRNISVSADELDDSLDLALVRDQDPVLFFQEGGKLLPSHMALPPEPVWVLYALLDSKVGPAFSGHILRTELPPLGWTGWSLALVDLSDLHDVRLSPDHPAHSIRTQSRATLATQSERSWVSMHGLPVQTTRPTLHLPDNISAHWRLRVIDLDSSVVLVDSMVDSHEEFHDAIDPFAQISGPIVGRFEVSIKGPFGRGVLRNLALVEDLTLDPNHPWRALSVSGLEPLSLAISGDGLSCTPALLDFGSDTSSLSATIDSHGRTAELTVSPPAMAVATLRSGIASRWSFGFVRIHLEDVADFQLLVKIQPDTPPSDLQIRVGDAIVQSVSPASKSGLGYANYALDVISDTARTHSGCDLFVVAAGSAIRVARIAPKLIASGATATDSSVTLTNFTGGGVEVRVWSLFAPWIPAACGAVDPDGKFELPDEMAAQAPFVISWQRSDPWIPCEWPWMPFRQFPRMPGHLGCTVIQSTSVISRFSDPSRFLAGEIESAPEVNQGDAWALLAMASSLPREYKWESVHVITASLRRDPDHAMRSLIDLPVSVGDRLSLLILSGVLWARSTSTDTVHNIAEDSESLLRSEQLIGPLLVLSQLVVQSDVVHAADCWRMLRDLYGTEIVSILLGKGDPAFKGGSFATAKWLDNLDPGEQEKVLSQLRLVPRALLDVDSRTSAALALFQERDNIFLADVGRDGRERLKFQSAILRDWNWDSALALLQARADDQDRGGWLSLSAQSAAFALVARLAAQGDEQASMHLDTNFRHWLALAQCAPQIVSTDLVLAEAMALAAFAVTPSINPFATDTDESESE